MSRSIPSATSHEHLQSPCLLCCYRHSHKVWPQIPTSSVRDVPITCLADCCLLAKLKTPAQNHLSKTLRIFHNYSISLRPCYWYIVQWIRFIVHMHNTRLQDFLKGIVKLGPTGYDAQLWNLQSKTSNSKHALVMTDIFLTWSWWPIKGSAHMLDFAASRTLAAGFSAADIVQHIQLIEGITWLHLRNLFWATHDLTYHT